MITIILWSSLAVNAICIFCWLRNRYFQNDIGEIYNEGFTDSDKLAKAIYNPKPLGSEKKRNIQHR